MHNKCTTAANHTTMVVSRAARSWNPQRYTRFEFQRLRPALDLLGQVEHVNPQRIVDVGCGTGNLTPFLRKRWPAAHILCVDSSAEMLDKARTSHEELGIQENVDYSQSDFETLGSAEETFDIIVSNAALHWVSFRVHCEILPKYMLLLNPDGVLAFQMPDSREQSSHQHMVRAMKEVGLGHHLENIRWVTTEADPHQYYNLLVNKCADLNMWTTTYTHIMEGRNPVADFTESTALGPYLEPLTPAEAETFIRRYRYLIKESYWKQKNGKTLFSMKRFFVVAKKRASKHEASSGGTDA